MMRVKWDQDVPENRETALEMEWLEARAGQLYFQRASEPSYPEIPRSSRGKSGFPVGASCPPFQD
jgi:hypothetical protein